MDLVFLSAVSVSDELLDEAADHFEAFFSEVFEELYKYGEVEDMVVCDNIGDHIIGNVYVKYSDDDAAKKALSALQGRYYAGENAGVLFPEKFTNRDVEPRLPWVRFSLLRHRYSMLTSTLLILQENQFRLSSRQSLTSERPVAANSSTVSAVVVAIATSCILNTFPVP